MNRFPRFNVDPNLFQNTQQQQLQYQQDQRQISQTQYAPQQQGLSDNMRQSMLIQQPLSSSQRQGSQQFQPEMIQKISSPRNTFYQTELQAKRLQPQQIEFDGRRSQYIWPGQMQQQQQSIQQQEIYYNPKEIEITQSKQKMLSPQKLDSYNQNSRMQIIGQSPPPQYKVLNAQTNQFQQNQGSQTFQNNQQLVSSQKQSNNKRSQQQIQQEQYLQEHYKVMQQAYQTLFQRNQNLEKHADSVQTQYLSDLQNKITQLIQANNSLSIENEKLAKQQNHLPYNNKRYDILQEKDYLQQQLIEYQEDCKIWTKRYDELAEQYNQIVPKEDIKEKESQDQIQYLVDNLQIKIKSLIQENGRLNTILSDKVESIDKINQEQQKLNNKLLNEKSTLQTRITIQNEESNAWKKKYEQLEERLEEIMKNDIFQEEYRQKIDILEKQITDLIQENDHLNTLINEQIQDKAVLELESRMSELVIQNNKLEESIEQWKNQCEDLQQQVIKVEKQQVENTQQSVNENDNENSQQ